MAKTIQDSVDAVNALKALVVSLQGDNASLRAEITNAENRLQATIATLQGELSGGTNTQPIIDALAPVTQIVSDEIPLVQNEIAAQKVTGIQFNFHANSNCSWAAIKDIPHELRDDIKGRGLSRWIQYDWKIKLHDSNGYLERC